MPGKQRSPHLHRTPTMSLLRSAADSGCFPLAASFSQPAPECLLEEGGPCFPQDAASLHRELSPPSRQFELLDHMEICASAGDAFAMEGSTLSSAMVLDGSIEESLLASHAPQQYSLYPAHQALGLGQRHPIPIHQGAAQYYMNTAAHSKAMAFSQGSAQPLHFLDACFLCSKRLGHGKDVFMYRGDRAFCSAECRHAQIVADERREKCGQQTPAKERVGVTIPLWDGSLLA